MSDMNGAPLGRWTGEVAYGGTVDEYGVLFEADGTLTMTTAESTGAGTWSPTGPDSFSFDVKEEFVMNEDGSPPDKVLPGAAYIRIAIDAQHDGTAYSGAGTARVFAADDSILHSTPVKTTARRADAQVTR
jgi:hypothetical protein